MRSNQTEDKATYRITTIPGTTPEAYFLMRRYRKGETWTLLNSFPTAAEAQTACDAANARR